MHISICLLYVLSYIIDKMSNMVNLANLPRDILRYILEYIGAFSLRNLELAICNRVLRNTLLYSIQKMEFQYESPPDKVNYEILKKYLSSRNIIFINKKDIMITYYLSPNPNYIYIIHN